MIRPSKLGAQHPVDELDQQRNVFIVVDRKGITELPVRLHMGQPRAPFRWDEMRHEDAVPSPTAMDEQTAILKI